MTGNTRIGLTIDQQLARIQGNARRTAARRWEEVECKIRDDGRDDRRTLGIREPNPFDVFKQMGRNLADIIGAFTPQHTGGQLLGTLTHKNSLVLTTMEELGARRQQLLADRARLEREDAISAILTAWNDAGTHPHYHRHQQARLRRSWPLLGRALDQLTDAHTGSARTNRH